VVVLGLLLAVQSAVSVNLIAPFRLEWAGSPAEWAAVLGMMVLPWLVLVGFVCGFLDCVLASGAAGESGTIRWPGRDVGLVLRSLVVWTVCFLAGPAELAALAYLYWLRGGDLDLLDKVVLAEMGLVAFAYWFFAVASVNQRERLLDANPLDVARLVDDLGYRAWALAPAAAGLGVVHLLGILQALRSLAESPVAGFVGLLAAWISALYWATFSMRLLGVWTYWSRAEASVSLPALPAR
jgi:hypothetical protein